jgi:hypothetical protein
VTAPYRLEELEKSKIQLETDLMRLEHLTQDYLEWKSYQQTNWYLKEIESLKVELQDTEMMLHQVRE